MSVARFHRGILGRPCLVLLVLLLSWSLIGMGGMIWIDNSIALIPDNDPSTSFNIDLITGKAASHKAPQLHQEGQVPDSSEGGLIVHGNGTRDDNREEPFFVQALSSVTVLPEYGPAVSAFNQRRTAVAYKDFGHLKLMSAEGDLSSVIYLLSFDHEKGPHV